VDDLKTVVAGPAIDDAVIDAWRNAVPDVLVDVWNDAGQATMLGGFIRFVDPGSLTELVRHTFRRHDGAVPLFTTALGDIGVLTDDAVELLKYRYGRVDLLTTRPGQLLKYLGSPVQRERANYLAWEPYPAAAARLGVPAHDECFGFTPLLALGGPEHADRLSVVKLREHVLMITQLTGPLH
jgi:hypothetical protein